MVYRRAHEAYPLAVEAFRAKRGWDDFSHHNAQLLVGKVQELGWKVARGTELLLAVGLREAVKLVACADPPESLDTPLEGFLHDLQHRRTPATFRIGVEAGPSGLFPNEHQQCGGSGKSVDGGCFTSQARQGQQRIWHPACLPPCWYCKNRVPMLDGAGEKPATEGGWLKWCCAGPANPLTLWFSALDVQRVLLYFAMTELLEALYINTFNPQARAAQRPFFYAWEGASERRVG